MNTTIANRHKLEDIVSTRLKLEKAAGCATKTVAYWGPRLLSLLDQLSASITNAGDLQAPSSGAPVPTQKAFEYTVFQCHLAYNADEKTKSAVTDAADDACYAMDNLLDGEVLKGCRTLDKSITKAVSMYASDPLACEAKGLSLKLAQRFGSLNCSMVIATATVEENEAKAKQVAAAQASAPSEPAPNPYEKRNAIVGSINMETQSFNNNLEVAKRWFDRGEDYEACGYYQQALTGLHTLETLYADLNRETGDSDYSAKSREMKDQQDVVLENYGATCAWTRSAAFVETAQWAEANPPPAALQTSGLILVAFLIFIAIIFLFVALFVLVFILVAFFLFLLVLVSSEQGSGVKHGEKRVEIVLRQGSVQKSRHEASSFCEA